MSANNFTFFTKDDAILVLQRKLKTTNFKFTSLNIEPLSDEIAGFLAEHFIVTMKIERNNLEETNTFFCKILPRSVPAHLKYISDIGAFETEVKFFHNILPTLQQNNAELNWAPTAYLVRSGLVVMEDLSKDGFKVFNNYCRILFDFHHSKVAAQTMAKFHAATLIYEEKYQLHKQGCNNISINNNYQREILFPGILFEKTYVTDPSHVRKHWMDVAIEGLLSLARIIPEINDPSKLMKINKELPRIVRLMAKFVKPSKKHRNAVSHGDLWCNNVMFKYDEEGIPVQGVLIDYQLVRYGPLAFDLMASIFNTTTEKDRNAFLKNILNAYYETMRIELKKHNLDIEIILPRTDFDTSCQYFECPAVVEALLFGQNILLPGSMAKDVMNSPEGYFDFVCNSGTKCRVILEAFEKDTLFRKRMTEMLVYLVEKFIL